MSVAQDGSGDDNNIVEPLVAIIHDALAVHIIPQLL